MSAKSKASLSKYRDEVRQAFADYVASEGCSCCRNTEAHEESFDTIAMLLNIPRYKDGSGWNVYKFTRRRRHEE